jgi:four helix bundle protein
VPVPGAGTPVAAPERVAGVTRFEDLECWQLANELKVGVYEIIETSTAKRDFKFCDQLKDAASSGTSNLSEAFGHCRHRESARYARIAKASLTETDNHLLDGVDRHHWTVERVAPLRTLARRALGATTGWIRYLESSDPPPS